MFEFVGGALCVDFSNTVRMVDGKETDLLPAREDFRRWAVEAGIAEEDDPPVSPDQFALAKALRDALNRFVRDIAVGFSPVGGVAEINALLAHARYGPVLTTESDGVSVRFAAGNITAEPIGRIIASFLDLVRSGAIRRLRKCENEHCILVFVDQSKAGRRRWCRMSTCGNREKSRRHYRRSREAKPSANRGD